MKCSVSIFKNNLKFKSKLIFTLQYTNATVALRSSIKTEQILELQKHFFLLMMFFVFNSLRSGRQMWENESLRCCSRIFFCGRLCDATAMRSTIFSRVVKRKWENFEGKFSKFYLLLPVRLRSVFFSLENSHRMQFSQFSMLSENRS